jgi:hypothetical protein
MMLGSERNSTRLLHRETQTSQHREADVNRTYAF